MTLAIQNNSSKQAIRNSDTRLAMIFQATRVSQPQITFIQLHQLDVNFETLNSYKNHPMSEISNACIESFLSGHLSLWSYLRCIVQQEHYDRLHYNNNNITVKSDL